MLTLDRVLFLKSVSMFADTSHEVLAKFARKLEEIRLASGDSVYQQGDRENSLYVVVEGTVRLHAEGGPSSMQHERELLGEFEAFDLAPRAFSATAAAKSHLLRIDPITLEELIAERPEISQALIREFCKRLRVPGGTTGCQVTHE